MLGIEPKSSEWKPEMLPFRDQGFRAYATTIICEQ